MAYHLIYQPELATCGEAERVVNLLETDSPSDVLLQLKVAPGSIAMELDALDFEDALQELSDLGFTC